MLGKKHGFFWWWAQHSKGVFRDGKGAWGLGHISKAMVANKKLRAGEALPGSQAAAIWEIDVWVCRGKAEGSCG